MKPRPDLLDEKSPDGIEVFQITHNARVPSCHVYMEAQIFTPDSKRFLLHRSAHAHGSEKNDPEHQYLLCDIENGCSLSSITDEVGVTAPSVTPDGNSVYYFVDQTEIGGGSLILKRVNIDGTDRRMVTMINSALPGTHFWPSRIYPLSTISSNGKRLALSCFLGDGKTDSSHWGLLVFDLENVSVDIVVHGPHWSNMHPQYCRSKDPENSHDILVQEGHGSKFNAQGEMIERFSDPLGVDIHVIRDDGSDFRAMPWGRTPQEWCQGHQCWRGRSGWAITGTITCYPDRNNPQRVEYRLIKSLPVGHKRHLGAATPGAVRNDLSAAFENPRFHHFATDIEGGKLVTDYWSLDRQEYLYFVRLEEPGSESTKSFTYLMNTRTAGEKQTQSHPFLSPDGTMAFFNSCESGLLQAYMIRGLENLAY